MQQQRLLSPPSHDGFALEEAKLHLGRGGGKLITTTYDLVEQVRYLYVHVVKARDLPTKVVAGACSPYVEVKLGNCGGSTRQFEEKASTDWNRVFAFSKDRIQSSVLEVSIKGWRWVGVFRVLVEGSLRRLALNEGSRRMPRLAPKIARLPPFLTSTVRSRFGRPTTTEADLPADLALICHPKSALSYSGRSPTPTPKADLRLPKVATELVPNSPPPPRSPPRARTAALCPKNPSLLPPKSTKAPFSAAKKDLADRPRTTQPTYAFGRQP